MKVEDNFLEQNIFDDLQDLMLGRDLEWYYNSKIDFENELADTFQFTHHFYDNNVPKSRVLTRLDSILEIISPISFWRIKANLLTRTPNIVENTFHIDILDISEEKLKQLTTSILYINTNNGYTKFEDGTKIESVANRMVTFPSNMKHLGTSCTDEKIRVVINFNYFK